MGSKLQVKVFADSRGTWLGHELNTFYHPKINFQVKYRKGASIVRIWEMVEVELIRNVTDLYVIFGGVCDLKRKSYDILGRRRFWPHNDLKLIFESLTEKMEGMAYNFRLVNHHSILCFLPEPGLDLLRYNQVMHPIPWYLMILQESLEKNLRILQAKSKVINASIGSLTPWTLEVTHAKRAGRLIPVFDRLHDGLHFSPLQVTRLARLLVKFAENTLLGHNHQAGQYEEDLAPEHGNGNHYEG